MPEVATPAVEPRPSMADRGLFGMPPTLAGVDFVAIGLVALVPLVDFPVVNQSTWSFREALLLLIMGPALVLLVRLAVDRDRAAQSALAFIALATVSAALSRTPLISLLGGYDVDRGVLVLAGYLGCWAIGRRVHPDAHRYVLGAFLGAVLVNVGWGVLQVRWGLQLGFLGVEDGRAAGFTPSSVYLGGLVAGALAVTGYLLARTTSGRRVVAGLLVATAVLSMGANLTGSRIALFGGIVVAVLPALLRRNWRIAGLVVVALAIGLGASKAIPQPVSSIGRVAGNSGVGTRTIMWKAALHAVEKRPVLGWGPGDFRAATSSRVTPAFVISQGQDLLFFDAHDLFVEQLTTVGLVGFAVLAAFGFYAIRRARGPLAWLALGIAVTWLLEPMSVSTAPVALLALGIAAPRIDVPRWSLPWKATAAALGTVGLLAGACVLHTAFEMKFVFRHGGTESELHQAERTFPNDGTLDQQEIYFAQVRAAAAPTAANRAAVVAAARKTVDADPGRPSFWTGLAAQEYRFGDRARAIPDLQQALKLDPWSESALISLEQLARAQHQNALAASANARLCRIESNACVH